MPPVSYGHTYLAYGINKFQLLLHHLVSVCTFLFVDVCVLLITLQSLSRLVYFLKETCFGMLGEEQQGFEPHAIHQVHTAYTHTQIYGPHTIA